MPFRYAYLKLRGGCYECDRIENLQMCTFCKVTRYCPEHKDSHHRRDEEGMYCRSVTWARRQMEVTLKRVQAEVGPEIDPVEVPFQHPFTFLDSHGIYRQACRHYGTALKIIKTRQSLEEQVKSFNIWRKYKPGWTNIVLPSALIRLNRDCEAWDVIRSSIVHYIICQMLVTGFNYDLWEVLDATRPEDIPNFLFHCNGCQFNVLGTLIKLRMLLDLECVERARVTVAALGKVPQEVLAHVVAHVPFSPIIAREKGLAYDDHEDRKKTMREQTEWMFLRVQKECSDIWFYILHGTLPSIRSCTCKPETLFWGDRCIWDDILPRSALREPWIETPGSLEYLESLINEHTMLLEL